MSIRVALVDDHAVVSEGLTTLLSQHDDLDVIGSVRDGAAALAMCDDLQPDVVLMDLSMPSMDGAEATELILSHHPEIRVIVLTGFLDEELVRKALAAGASGYLMKSIGGAELADAIRAAHNGQATLSLEALPGAFAASELSELPVDLTAREVDVLERMVEGASNKEIAVALSLSPGTVRVHVSSILSKLGVANRTAAAHVARRRRLVPDESD